MLIENVSLKHNYSDKEYADLAKAQAAALDTIRSKEADLESVKKSLQGDIAVAKAELQNLSQKVHNGFDVRDVRCLLLDERPAGYRLVVRLDTGSIARRRMLEPHERQIKLSSDAPKFFAFATILKIDDESWPEDFFETPLYDDEAAAMKEIPGLTFRELPRNAARQITDGKEDHGTKGGKKK